MPSVGCTELLARAPRGAVDFFSRQHGRVHIIMLGRVARSPLCPPSNSPLNFSHFKFWPLHARLGRAHRVLIGSVCRTFGNSVLSNLGVAHDLLLVRFGPLASPHS
jgi:hypothetical protein